MSEKAEDRTVRRILVAVDASRNSQAALRAAAELAAALEAEVQGLFVEDVDLLRLASSPIALEIQYPLGQAHHLDELRMERELKAQAVRARDMIETLCNAHQIEWSFRVVRGQVTSTILAAALDADILSLGMASSSILRRVPIGSTARAAMETAPCCVMLSRREGRVGTPVAVAFDGSTASGQALLLAARIAVRKRGYLAVLILAGTAAEARHLQVQASGQLQESEVIARFRLLPEFTVARLSDSLHFLKAGLLVTAASSLSASALDTLLGQIACPMLLVRGPDSTERDPV
jgi:nucleotide-binding universal stress UspA family protein